MIKCTPMVVSSKGSNKQAPRFDLLIKALLIIAVILMTPLFYDTSVIVGGPLVPNAAAVIGIVLGYDIVSSRLLGIQPEQSIYKITLRIESSEDMAGFPNFLRGKEGQEVSFYTKAHQSSDILGKKLRANVSYSGDERGGGWWLREVKVLQ